MSHTLVLLRHGESTWNKENRFTGWTDVDLSETGHRGGARGRPAAPRGRVRRSTSPTPRSCGGPSGRCGSSLDELDRMWLPVEQLVAAQRAPLRRPPGPEQGRDGRSATATTQVRHLAPQLRRAAAARSSRRRASPVPRPALRRASTRTLPPALRVAQGHRRPLPARTGTEAIAPAVRSGQRVLIAAHGNSLRALVKYLDDVSDEDIVGLNIPTGVPLVYELDEDLRPLGHRYLGDQDRVAAAMAAVAAQGTARAAGG